MSYVLNTPADQKAMLEAIGVGSIEELFALVPDQVRLKRPLAIAPALSEIELQQHMTELAGSNRSADDAVCFLGGGSYDHFIPAVVDAVAGRSEFYTAYTPYQAEASQGSFRSTSCSSSSVLPTSPPTSTAWPPAAGSRSSASAVAANAELNLLTLMGKRGRIHGSTLRPRPLEQKGDAAHRVEHHVLPSVASGRVTVPVAATYPMTEAEAAYDRFAAGGKLGKIVLLRPG